MTAMLCVLGMIASVGLRPFVAQGPDTEWVEVTGPGIGRPRLQPVVVMRTAWGIAHDESDWEPLVKFEVLLPKSSIQHP